MVKGEWGMSIQRDVRQGCVFSPLLFNLYSAEIFTQALKNCEKGIKINRERLNNI